jgi:hypothetical protein
LFRRKINTPFLTIGQDSHRHTLVEGVLKKLDVASGSKTCALYLEKNARTTCSVEKSKVYASACDSVLRCY